MGEVLAGASSTEKERRQREYELLYEAFVRLLDKWDDDAGCLEEIEDIIELRASFLIERSLEGLNIDFDRALQIIRAKNDFTTHQERQQRDVLVAAIENLVDFATAEEYNMISELDEEIDEDLDEDELEYLYEELFDRYNGAGALQEDRDVFYASVMAAWWLGVSSETMITFMTMGDERVRPWHEAYEGYSFPKSQFPPELIPPIEWGCRCYLEADGFASVMGRAAGKKKPRSVNPVFKESLATGGRIFSDEHPYFRTELPYNIRQIRERIKRKFYGNE